MTVNLINFVEGLILLETYEIIPSDHCRYIINLNLEDYFETKLTKVNIISFQFINPLYLSHRDKYKEELEKIMETMDF